LSFGFFFSSLCPLSLPLAMVFPRGQWRGWQKIRVLT
jgi:hypothetical protein